MGYKAFGYIQVCMGGSGFQGSLNLGEYLRNDRDHSIEFAFDNRPAYGGDFLINNVLRNGQVLAPEEVYDWLLGYPNKLSWEKENSAAAGLNHYGGFVYLLISFIFIWLSLYIFLVIYF